MLAAILVGGWFVADGLTAAKAGTSADSLVLETTVNKLITVREKGKLVTKVVPVVKRVVRIRQHTQTQVERQTDLRYSTRVLTEPGGVRVVRRVVTTTTRVPVVKNHVVTVNGKTKRVAVTSYVPTTRVETQTQTQTQTETRQQTVTQSAAPNTITQVSTANHTTTDVQTQTQTQTVTTVQTATVTTTNVVTEVQTVTNTVTDTQTVTEPPVTITITLPSP